MLTLTKICVYRKYGGDIDGLARANNLDDSSLVTDEEWLLINLLVQKLSLVKNGKASPEFARQISVEVHQSVEGEEALNELMEIA